MKTTSIISMLALAAATLAATATSCSKKDNPAPEIQTPEPEDPEGNGTPLPAPSAAGFAKLREDALEKLKKTQTFNMEEKGYNSFTLTTEKGTSVSFGTAFCLRKQNNDPVTGDIEATFTDIYDRGSMVIANRPLMGQNADGKIVPLVTGGQFLFDAKQGDDLLTETCPKIMKIPVALTGGYSPVSGGGLNEDGTLVIASPTDDKMKPWKASVGNDGMLTWSFMNWDIYDQGYEGHLTKNDFDNDNYQLGVSLGLGHWTGIGRFYVPSGQTTQLKVNVPDGYNAQNASVYLAYEGEKYLLAQLYDYDAAGKHFTEPEGFVPVGQKVHAIFVSESEGKFVVGVKTVTVAANAEVTFAHKDLETIEPDKLAEKVNGLD